MKFLNFIANVMIATGFCLLAYLTIKVFWTAWIMLNT